ncbi:hypothetical protein LAUMK7_05655 [Mycobacterium kansasii]|nr:hypothetical protein MKANGN_54220 [Mycobacterium kansasii]VAZ61798.1 hypothetical protein LAUMK22_03616 [Mycobacterium kansasii]VAZ69773.1 hypothetical protein LAUMK40_05936 [Mycobacterium kansasii]VAZ81046.1 hypothetical protein LAUMK7_05655 [Mycobacterium kansasii]VTP01183.1 hypothetical protein BIN_B_02801 [Mycobacterium kansasii]
MIDECEFIPTDAEIAACVPTDAEIAAARVDLSQLGISEAPGACRRAANSDTGHHAHDKRFPHVSTKVTSVD